MTGSSSEITVLSLVTDAGHLVHLNSTSFVENHTHISTAYMKNRTWCLFYNLIQLFLFFWNSCFSCLDLNFFWAFWASVHVSNFTMKVILKTSKPIFSTVDEGFVRCHAVNLANHSCVVRNVLPLNAVTNRSEVFQSCVLIKYKPHIWV